MKIVFQGLEINPIRAELNIINNYQGYEFIGQEPSNTLLSTDQRVTLTLPPGFYIDEIILVKR